MKLLIGIDGGGTKTDLVLCDTTGRIVNRVREIGSNPNDIGLNASMKILNRGINSLIHNQDKLNIISLFAGISGGITGDNRDKIHIGLKNILGDNIHIQNHSDALCAMSSGIDDKNGCVIISGTGSIGYGRRNGDIKRVGGYGYLIDKGGSGFDYGRDALYYALSHKDGRSKATLITQLIEEKTGDLINEVDNIYKLGKAYIASFAPIVFEAYKKNDAIAKIIVENNATELAKTFNTLAEFISEDTCHAVLVGSVFKDFDVIQKYLTPHLNYNFNFVFPDLPPVYGSIVEAATQEGIAINSYFKNNFKTTLKE